MAQSILSSLSSKVSFLILNDMLGTQVIPNIKIKSVKIRYVSQNMGHKMETGLYKVDARIIMPMTLDISCICPDIDTQEQLVSFLKDNTAFYTVYSKGLVFLNMMVDQEAISQTADMLSASGIQLRMKQVLVEGTAPVTAAQPADSSIIDQGYISLASTVKTATGLFSTAYQSASAGLVG
jgi:hypothetical protein